MDKALALLLALCLLLAGCSPGAVFEPMVSEPPEETPVQMEKPTLLRLPVNLRDSLHPYKVTTQVNQSLTPLLYDGLFRLGRTYGAEPVIAASARAEDAVWRVQLGHATFSDGSAVTPQDVVYSYYQAAAPGSPYALRLRQVQSCTAQEGAVVFTLGRPNSLFVNNLIFPIVKADTGGRELPVGSGRFVVTGSDSGGFTLKPGRDAARCGPIAEVQLVAMADEAMMASALKVGTIDLLLALQSDREEALSGVDSQTLDLNALNYLAVGQRSAILADPAVRRAIYLAINRDELAQLSYGSKAAPAYTPFSPLVNWLPDAQFVGRDGPIRAIDLLLEAGYTPDVGDSRLTLELLVNRDSGVRLSAAHRLRDQLARAGIKVTVADKPREAYLSDYAAGRYDLCLGEMLMGDDMALDLILPGISTDYGELSDSYNRFLADTAEADAFLAEFLAQNPFIPLVYRYGTLASARNFNTSLVATRWDIFYNMAEW